MAKEKRGGKSRRDEGLIPLTDVITSLDSVRGYKRRGSQNLEEKFRRLGEMGYSDLREVWWDIDDDVMAIVDMPMKAEGVPGMIRLHAYLRLASRIAMIMLVIVIAARFVWAWRPYIGESVGGNLPLIIAVSIACVATINGEIVLDYLIRRRIVSYEKASEAQYAKHVAKLKVATQKVITLLGREVRRLGKDPYEFPIMLFFPDYDKITVIKSRTPRSMGIFKKNFKVYTAVVN